MIQDQLSGPMKSRWFGVILTVCAGCGPKVFEAPPAVRPGAQIEIGTVVVSQEVRNELPNAARVMRSLLERSLAKEGILWSGDEEADRYVLHVTIERGEKSTAFAQAVIQLETSIFVFEGRLVDRRDGSVAGRLEQKRSIAALATLGLLATFAADIDYDPDNAWSVAFASVASDIAKELENEFAAIRRAAVEERREAEEERREAEEKQHEAEKKQREAEEEEEERRREAEVERRKAEEKQREAENKQREAEEEKEEEKEERRREAEAERRKAEEKQREAEEQRLEKRFVIALDPWSMRDVEVPRAASPERFSWGDVRDQRPDAERIGRREALGVSMGDVFFNRDVTRFLQEAIADELLAEGHQFAARGEGRSLDLELATFWVETNSTVLYWDVEATVELRLILESRQVSDDAIVIEGAGTGHERTYRWPSTRVMGSALDDAFVATMEALRAHPCWPARLR